MFDSFHLQLHVATPPTPVPPPTATAMALQACQALGNQALALRLIRALDFTPDQRVVILLSGGLREAVKVLDLEPALYYLQGLLDGAKVGAAPGAIRSLRPVVVTPVALLQQPGKPDPGKGWQCF